METITILGHKLMLITLRREFLTLTAITLVIEVTNAYVMNCNLF